MLISSPEFYCSNEILSLTALLSVPQLFVRPAAARKRADEMKDLFAHQDGDHLTMLNENPKQWCHDHFLSFRALQQADNVRLQLRRIMEREELELVSTPFEDKKYYENIRRALAAGFFMPGRQEGQFGQDLRHRQGQPERAAPPFHRPGPGLRVGRLQRVCPDE
ncbi:putative pre-mRNA-splicing factor ATP-dependent RNA helicase prp43 [Hortaea werneckii EXF-2000]|uniref:RNA helicase n=1 Tax=Hortaea werneckii EXF-2000 TaxID=1157616 RepID=A0A1Z5SN80_HORWE|nr:putative pre-mRNA-splicing factor ATP-dependent RNA helicase prp43 [Hortaea werneckii EXF-2000]